jgi:cystathionine beta-synthase
MILADPVRSVLARRAGSWTVEGSGEDFVPPNADLSLIRQACAVSDQDSFATARDLLRHEGVLAGSSTRTLLAGLTLLPQARAARSGPGGRFGAAALP